MAPNRIHGDHPILDAKDTDAASVFQPEGLLREARRQRVIPAGEVPEACVLDPDGDILRYLRHNGRARRLPSWACYHTELYVFDHGGREFGIVGCAVGAPFAVLIAEEMRASGCWFLLSMTSAGQIADLGSTPYFILIERAIRDEGTSYHYLPPAEMSDAPAEIARRVAPRLAALGRKIHRGITWTTDAPFRETERAITVRQAQGALAVEMEAAGLYAFAQARNMAVLCFAQVTNQLARIDGDFEKGEIDGALDALELLALAADAWFTGAPTTTTAPDRPTG